MVTPFRFLAVTVMPVGKTRSIFLMGGVESIFLSASGLSTLVGEVLIFLRGSMSKFKPTIHRGAFRGGQGRA